MITPKLIENLKEYEIVEIKCGHHMSYCKSRSGKNFLWGTNLEFECMKYHEMDDIDDDTKKVKILYQIDNVVQRKCNGRSIVCVYPGFCCTKLVVR